MRPRLLGERYRLGPVIGVGGMGAVHRARDERLGRDVAVKVLRAGAGAADCERLRREVEYLGTVQHPNLVAILDGGADGSDLTGIGDGGIAWFAMELVVGPDLRTLQRKHGPLGGEAVRRVLIGVLGALAALHSAGLVHRDVTPSNILLTADPFARWDVKLADLGIARRILSVPLTDVGHVVGTAAYLSPEQVLGGEVGPPTDVYALALVALEALTGITPFPGTAVESATSRLLRPPALPAELSPQWRDLLIAATSVDPAHRPHAAAFRAAVHALPDDAGVRPDRPAVLAGEAAPETSSRPSGASAGARNSAVDASSRRSTAVLPVGLHATAVMQAAARTAELVLEPHPRSRSRAAVVLAASAAIIGGIAVAGSAAVIAAHDLRPAPVTLHAASPTPRPESPTSAAAQPDEASQEDQAGSEQADRAQSDVAARSDGTAPPASVAPAGPFDDAVGPEVGPAGPIGRSGPAGPAVDGAAAGPDEQAAAAGPEDR